ncbi:ribbon-helix-helix protein, CopG family [Geodermatophilus sp. DF01-2]|uniref:ribbon-helix-helix protein, CopG family n=1 Tax=Geodermatophilus sp. DF01-2 TaxID=2559610 RepID=UPI001073B738|nr:ribbon-helix-helix protein, CopG family [Geodermatophilus sp. DF01_2]TFV54444.1 ribbon-helix-helix protein, CopG family [Geodermatophilus sp. DF01_2]
MRTTVNLDDDVMAAVERLRREEGLGLSDAVNRLARAGLSQRRSARRFRQRTTSLEFTVDVRNIGEVLDLLDEVP